jgi:N6-L-threonylcarbamoyladenine synthase
MKILAIESSCDETAAAVVQDGCTVLGNVISTSRLAFEQTGGVIPEDAARRQVECILPVIHGAMKEAKADWSDIDAIAVTRGPGLLGSLLVGTVAARAIAQIQKKPLVGVHHTLGHLSSTWLGTTHDDAPTFPILTLSASGGHTDLWLRKSHIAGTLLGRTRDDAAGEAFDKGAFLLGLPYPGGPSISKAGTDGNPKAFDFPLPLRGDDSLEFSFSGLKTSLRYIIRDLDNGSHGRLPIADLAASYEYALCMHLCDRVRLALEQHPDIQEVHLVGGVSANTRLRAMLTASAPGVTIRFPATLAYCTDNAAMIGAAAEFMVREQGNTAYDTFETIASLPLASAVITTA